jgi:hypothetical protein
MDHQHAGDCAPPRRIVFHNETEYVLFSEDGSTYPNSGTYPSLESAVFVRDYANREGDTVWNVFSRPTPDEWKPVEK